jgi:hypothetical protein
MNASRPAAAECRCARGDAPSGHGRASCSGSQRTCTAPSSIFAVERLAEIRRTQSCIRGSSARKLTTIAIDARRDHADQDADDDAGALAHGANASSIRNASTFGGRGIADDDDGVEAAGSRCAVIVATGAIGRADDLDLRRSSARRRDSR